MTKLFDLRSRQVEDSAPARVPVGAFGVDDVWARTPADCILCGRPLDRSLPAWDAMAGVPDWVVPPSQGGEMVLSNRVMVHRACWSRKAA